MSGAVTATGKAATTWHRTIQKQSRSKCLSPDGGKGFVLDFHLVSWHYVSGSAQGHRTPSCFRNFQISKPQVKEGPSIFCKTPG